MSTTTAPTREQLRALQELDRLYGRLRELDDALKMLRRAYAALELAKDRQPPLKYEDLDLVEKHFGELDDVDAAAIRHHLKALLDDLGHIDLDSYSLDEALGEVSKLDELLDNAGHAMQETLVGEEADEDA